MLPVDLNNKDKEGVAVVLCEKDQAPRYTDLVSGETELESSLHLNLTEHLNSEIALETITSISTAQQWLRGTFLFQRIQKNPTHYGLDKPSGQTWQGRLDELVAESINCLDKAGLAQKDPDSGRIQCTEYGIVMSKVRSSQTSTDLRLNKSITL
jgi:ATP-dependent DNA helicase HFM1/MER3